MKKWFFLIALIFILPNILAINIQVAKNSQNEVLIADSGQPVTFDLNITNLGLSDNFQIYNLAGFSMNPNNVTIQNGQTKEITLQLTPIGSISQRGYYTVPYFIQASDRSIDNESATFKIIDMKDAFQIGSGNVDPQSQSIDIYIQNLVNFDFGNADVNFSSPFFNLDKTVALSPYEKQTFTVQLNQADFRSLMAGFYTLNAQVNAIGKTADVEGVIKYGEKDILTTTKQDYGILINTEVIDKQNQGNTVVSSETVIQKNIISRLFTSFTPTPDIVQREGLVVYYTWTKNINPGETFEITVKTNWLFPFILVLLVVLVVFLVRKYTGTSLVLRKRVSFVRAKGGEFALRVSISAQARNHVERVNIVDQLPMMVKLHERFGGDAPTRVDERNRRIEWNIDAMNPGEVRIFSYIIYSKVGVVGRFELPTATAVFDREGNIHEIESNKAFFVSEQRAMSED
ncbi:MAG: hypothetical protein ABSG05_00265 [Candidatus Pacearchaeota archaeon]|jgi:hypothetical protein